MATILSTVNFGDIKGNAPILEQSSLSAKINEINDIDKNFAKFKNSSGIALGLNAKVYATAGVGIADDDDHYYIKVRYPEQSESNDYVHILSSVGEHTFTAPFGVSQISVLLVGGGGGDLRLVTQAGVGCGAGAVVLDTIAINGGQQYNVIIGDGFKQKNNAGCGEATVFSGPNLNVFAYGGGANNAHEKIGCSSGSTSSTKIDAQTSDVFKVYANKGGISPNVGTGYGAAGGGGAGGEGFSTTSYNGANGGNGILIDIVGEECWYAAGGGGGAWNNVSRGGAPGQGTVIVNNVPKNIGGYGYGQVNSSMQHDAIDGTGSGGGGCGGGKGPAHIGGSGGSGIAVIRYTVPNLEYVGTSIGEGAIIGVDAPGSIQLGSGTNNIKDTVQIKEYPFLSSDGKIYEERFPNELLNSNLSSTVYSAISSNIQHILGDPMIFKGVFSPTEDYKRGNVVLTNFFEYVCSVDFQSHGAWNDVISGFVYLGDEGSYVKKGEIMDADIDNAANIQLSKIEGGGQLASNVASLNTDVQNLNTNSVKKYELGNFASCDYQIMSQAEYDALETKQSNKLYIISADI